MSSDNKKKWNRASSDNNGTRDCCSAGVRVKEEESSSASSTRTTKNRSTATSTIASPPQEEESQRSADANSRDMVELLSADSRDMVELLVQEIGLEGVMQHIIQKHGLDAVCRIVNRIGKDRGLTTTTTDAAVIPSSVVSSSSCSAATTAAHPAAPTTTQTSPVAFVEKDFVPEEEKREREARKHLKKAPPPEPIARGAAFTSGATSNDKRDGVIVQNEDALTAASEGTLTSSGDDTTRNKKRKQRFSMTPIMQEENLNNNEDSTRRNRREKPKRKQWPSEDEDEDEDDSTYPNDNPKKVKKRGKKKKNTTTTNRRGCTDCEITSQKQPIVADSCSDNNNHALEQPITTGTTKDRVEENVDMNNNDSTTNYETNSSDNNFCEFCNNPDWENKIYYKCGTVLSKYFPKSVNNPNPGWYKGTIRMHRVSSYGRSVSVSEYEEEEKANGSRSDEEESHRQRQSIVVFNEIHYEDGDKENITQNDLKLQLNDGHQVRIVPSTGQATSSNSESGNPADDEPLQPSSDTNNRKWLEMYHRLQKFKAKNGSCRVPQRYGPDPSLGKWVSKQRQDYKKGILVEDRVKKLNEIGFEWAVIAGTPNKPWDEMFGRLKQFKAENGHCRVPQKYCPDPSLGYWVNNQRQDYKKGNMAPDRTEKLEEIGFEFALNSKHCNPADDVTPPTLSDRNNQIWLGRYNRLKQFRAENGNCQVPYNYEPDPSFGKWVTDQRHCYKKGNMAPDRVEKLQEIGFDWSLKDQAWDKNFGRLEQFKTENGHCQVPSSIDPQLADWAWRQRRRYQEGQMPPHHSEKLEEIGFDWGQTKSERWDDMFGRLEQFKAKNGNFRVPSSYGPDPQLGKWVHTQRATHRDGKMGEDRKKKLNQIGFDWLMIREAPDQTWQDKCDRLVRFRLEHGHCGVPRRYGQDPSLGHWVVRQRRNHKKGKLAEDRVKKLNEIGFQWQCVTGPSAKRRRRSKEVTPPPDHQAQGTSEDEDFDDVPAVGV